MLEALFSGILLEFGLIELRSSPGEFILGLFQDELKILKFISYLDKSCLFSDDFVSEEVEVCLEALIIL